MCDIFYATAGYNNLDQSVDPRDGMRLDGLSVNRPTLTTEAGVNRWLTDVYHDDSAHRKTSCADVDELGE